MFRFSADLLSKQRVEWILERYTNGIREYADLDDTVLGELVVLGFLIPVLIGYFLPKSAANHESPINQWQADARQAGFTNVTKYKLFRYGSALPAGILFSETSPGVCCAMKHDRQ